ncbi:glucoside xylosyltransferase 2-like [Sycon ciliatum]|uniref:glucoside xylosyltransferase 2-like n=1 Tax=Sycon ciliatum TaxID=27933 RepID=UPI0020AB662B|eukprot:scpid84677/ scgid22539/ Glucoside xylosyltransferase 2; Glycosyltransferase 8 domain-containing protein 4
MATRSRAVVLMLLWLCVAIGEPWIAGAEDDGGMCTMETKKTCSDDTEDASGGEKTDHYSEEVNTPSATEAAVGSDANPPMSTMADRPAVDSQPKKKKAKKGAYWEGLEHLHVGCVICGDRVPEALVMMKSGVVFSTSPLTFHIFTEDNLKKDLSKELNKWPDVEKQRVTYKFHPIKYPDTEDSKTWRETFKPCATMRLFIPTTTDIDSLIYLDTDILFMTPVEKVWKHFSQFNSTQLAAVAPESEDLVNSWYPRFARHPFYGAAGINSGVMLMNLTRMRAVHDGRWQSELIEIFREYRHNISWGDQCLLNIYFHRHPELVHVYGCDWNYRPDHCMYGVNNCHLSPTKSPKLFHGNRRAFHDVPRQPFFTAVYEEFVKMTPDNGLKSKQFVKDLAKAFDRIQKDNCLLARKPLLDGIRQASKSVSSRKERLKKAGK